MKVASSLDALIGETPLVDISNLVDKKDVNIYAKLEGLNPTGSIKDRIAKYMIDTAEKNGTIKPGQTILEPTSGNTGIALALQARMRGYKLKVVIPESVSQERFELGNIVLILADGGWKYLSTQLWTKDYSEIEENVKDVLWW